MAETANTDERLTQINQELSSLLEAKMEFLTRTLSETQRFTQKIANTELEIQRNTSQHARFKSECETLETDLASLAERVKTVSAERDGKQNEKYAQEKELQRLEWEIADARKSIEEGTGRIDALSKEKAALDKDAKKLQAEVDKLEAGVKELRELKERLLGMSSALKSELGAGGEG
jgi:chromosome segregation ATPase